MPSADLPMRTWEYRKVRLVRCVMAGMRYLPTRIGASAIVQCRFPQRQSRRLGTRNEAPASRAHALDDSTYQSRRTLRIGEDPNCSSENRTWAQTRARI